MANITVCDGCNREIACRWHYVFEYYEVFEDGRTIDRQLLHFCARDCLKKYANNLESL